MRNHKWKTKKIAFAQNIVDLGKTITDYSDS